MSEDFLSKFPLGLRTDNPCCVEHANYVWWEGEVAFPMQGKCVFGNVVYGVRAAVRTMRAYMEKDGLRTVYDIIRRWSGLVDPDLEAYLVSVLSGMPGSDSQSLVTDGMLPALICAIARYECGFPVLTPELVSSVIKSLG